MTVGKIALTGAVLLVMVLLLLWTPQADGNYIGHCWDNQSKCNTRRSNWRINNDWRWLTCNQSCRCSGSYSGSCSRSSGRCPSNKIYRCRCSGRRRNGPRPTNCWFKKWNVVISSVIVTKNKKNSSQPVFFVKAYIDNTLIVWRYTNSFWWAQQFN